MSVEITSATANEVTLVEQSLDARFVDNLPQHLIGDSAYDSDPLDTFLESLGIEMISPNRSSRILQTQDRSPLKGYTRYHLSCRFRNSTNRDKSQWRAPENKLSCTSSGIDVTPLKRSPHLIEYQISTEAEKSLITFLNSTGNSNLSFFSIA